MNPRVIFYLSSGLALAGIAGAGALWAPMYFLFAPVVPIVMLGIYDVMQRDHAILRNFPVVGHGRYILESVRPEISQYFIEQNHDGRPMTREQRSIVYQRAKGELSTLPFGTQLDTNAIGYEWINHSMLCLDHASAPPRVTIGASRKQPYEAALLNVSAMSFGSLSTNAILALNEGARRGGFYHNTGEGGLSDHHLAPGGDLVWQIGTGYFGCRAADGGFDLERFRDNAAHDSVKMIEVKLSQGAKPGHGGILPAVKITPEISRIRGVPMGQDVLSPPRHRTFSTPTGLLEWIEQLREASGGKPVGFKFCLGKRHEFMAIAKAMKETGLVPDYIAVDGGEGGTGAAPLEFSNRIGSPLSEALVFVHNTLVGFDLREDTKVIATGKVVTGFDIARLCAIGADLTCSARAMMLALGCIQALRCNSNHCPTGVATQNPALMKGLDVEDKADRVHCFQRDTVLAMMEVVGAAGLEHPRDLRPWHIKRRRSETTVQHYGEIFVHLARGQLTSGDAPEPYRRPYEASEASSFAYVGDH